MLDSRHITSNYKHRKHSEQWKRGKIEKKYMKCSNINVCVCVCQKTITSLVLFNLKCFAITSVPAVLFILKTLVIIVWLWFFPRLSLALCVLLSSRRKIVRVYARYNCIFSLD